MHVYTYAGHLSISLYSGHVSISPYAGHVSISPYAGSARDNVRRPDNLRTNFSSIRTKFSLCSGYVRTYKRSGRAVLFVIQLGSTNKKYAISKKTVEKWVVENDRELNTSVGLKFEGDRNHVFSLKCVVCSEFKDKLISMRNYRPAFIEGTTNIRTRHSRITWRQTCTLMLWFF